MTEWIQTGFWDKEVKKRVKKSRPAQTEMFSSREVAQFGINPHPNIPITELTALRLFTQDTRTPEEKQREELEANAAGQLVSEQTDQEPAAK